jgi:hypothetical protein
MKRGPKPVQPVADPEKLYSEIGRLKVEWDWLKKSPGFPYEDAESMDQRKRSPANRKAVRLDRSQPHNILYPSRKHES